MGVKKEYTVLVGTTPVYVGAIRTANLVASKLIEYRKLVIAEVGSDYQLPNVLVAIGAYYK